MVKCALGGAADARTRIKTSPPSQAKKTSGAMSVERCTGALRETKMKTAQREECHTGGAAALGGPPHGVGQDRETNQERVGVRDKQGEEGGTESITARRRGLASESARRI